MSELALKLIAENKQNRSPTLDLGNCGLTRIPDQLAELVWLEEVSFSNEWWNIDDISSIHHKTENNGSINNIQNLATDSDVFSNLVNIKKIYLCGSYRNQFSLDDLTPLNNIGTLKQLFISNTQIKDLSPLSNHSSLQRLVASSTQISDLSPLRTLKLLQKLVITNTKVNDLSPLRSLTSLEVLELSFIHVSELGSLNGLCLLKQLNISGTNVSELSSISKLSLLQKLNVSYTQVIDLAPLASLTSLQQLNACGTQVCNLDPLKNLNLLQRLDVSNSKIHDLEPLGNLNLLQTLNVSHTQIRDLTPLAIHSSLKQLNVASTQVHSLKPLSNLSSLQQLQAYDTQISDIGPMRKHGSLQVLDISGTNVSNLSPLLNLIENAIEVSWIDWDGRGIHIGNCELNNPPLSVVKQGNAAILNYITEQQEHGVDYLYEAKMLIIGEGGAGKTTLMRRLYQTDKPLPDEKDSTKGIDIHRQEFKLQNGRDFRLNVWDFGGQEIYHATHQFFLTKRSLYVLLDDTRKDDKSVHDNGFKYWLELIDLLGDHSPILIFQNEKNGRSKRIDQQGIKGKYTNVMDFYQGNLEKSHAADQIREAIQYYVQKLPHIGDVLPAKWVLIRYELKELSKHHAVISLQTYFDIYSKHLKFDREKALFLSTYLHDLGVFLHFQDDALLSRTLILQNQWATEAVFKILDDEIVKAKQGYFNTNDCQRLWQESNYTDMYPELLALMYKFELCYQLPDQVKEVWLAPQLLLPSRPDSLYQWAKPSDLAIRFRYTFLPKGMISRLIVRMHRFVKQPQLCWNNGVLFEYDDAELLAEIPEQGSEIVLRSRGADAKTLLDIIVAEIDALNATFHGLTEIVEKLIPCNCSCCARLSDPEFFEHRRLLQRKKDGKLQLECPASYEIVHLLSLLDGISSKQLPEWVAKLEENEEKHKMHDAPQHTIKIFLASSSELEDERDQFDLYFRQQNDVLRKKRIYLQIIRWENFLDAMSSTRLQDEYNKQVIQCDIFVSLFFTKTGKYSEEEFDTAHQQFLNTGKPLIYTFFKNDHIEIGNVNKQDIKSLWAFQEKLADLGHFHTEYTTIEHLKRQFKDQLDKLLE